MQRSQSWWSSLTSEQQQAVLAMRPGHLEPWVLDSMHAAKIALVAATVDSEEVRLPPAVTTDLIEQQRARGPIVP